MKKYWILITLLSVFLITASAGAQILTAPMIEEEDELEPYSLPEIRETTWELYKTMMLEDETLIRETQQKAMTFGDATMRYTVEVRGEKPEDGYPLFIAMHGGGSDDTPYFNDSQWEDMQSYYTEHLDNCVYVAVRGVRDTWDTHFNPESYPLYDRLIQYMILTEDVDPNRVYLTGFSAGGDGVYAVGARMADRFAAANMSSGHPNGISMINFYHLPLQLQAGEYDTAYDRHLVTAEYGLILDELQSEFEDGYEHRTLIHVDRGHNYEDYDNKPVEVYSDIYGYLSGENHATEMQDSYAPDWLNRFARDPLPQTLRWDLNTRADQRETMMYYYVGADEDASGSLFIYREDNSVYIEAEEFEGDFVIFFNEDMIDFEEPVHFVLAEGELDVMLIPEISWLEYTTTDRGDPNYQFEAGVAYSWLLSNLQ